MANLFDMFDAAKQSAMQRPDRDLLTRDLVTAAQASLGTSRAEMEDAKVTSKAIGTVVSVHSTRMMDDQTARSRVMMDAVQGLTNDLRAAQSGGTLAQSWQDYTRDSSQRLALTLDVLRMRGDTFMAHEAEGCPPVLAYPYEVVMDGADLDRPSNYMLLRILPPEGTEIKEWKRPYMIIDPRAGHGPGIGGFKADSQVGVALRDGHPVYFVSFRRKPEPGQTLADVTRAEASFVREIMRRHPDAPKPVITGNCQGGWATLLLAATNPDLTGPIVLNGSPIATWGGDVGTNPMRYNAGVMGGAWIPMLMSDMGNGTFDGAYLVQNFEMLNPGRTMFRKYTDLYRDIDHGAERFLEFETWWGGFFLMNEAEIRWIVEQLFVGNRLVKNEAQLEPGRAIDLKSIRAPIIVFTSWGDNITPPQQALNWIVDSYADVAEIKIKGQRIIYMVHDQVGHLGIFVSSQIANKEHAEVGSTLKTIETLAPGLYEMKIDAFDGHGETAKFTVSFAERTLDDIRGLDDGRADERPFAAVARASEMQAQGYEMLVRPMVKSMVSEAAAEASRAMHPLRAQRALWSSRNPATNSVKAKAEVARAERQPAAVDNPFIQAERLWMDMVEQSIDMIRDNRDMMFETMFFSIWGTPWMRAFGKTHEASRTLKSVGDLRNLPEVQAALLHVDRGGFVEAVVRVIALLDDTSGSVNRTRLERANRVLTQEEPFASLSADERARLIHQQTLITTYDAEGAVLALPKLLASDADRQSAMAVVRYIAGPLEDVVPATVALLHRLHDLLKLPAMTGDVLTDPLNAEAPALKPKAARTKAKVQEAAE